MYSLHGYGSMIRDAVRMSAYAEALHEAIQPGDVVVDLGAGPGIHALLACRFGARRVYAIEPAPVIELARCAAQANGFEDRIRFFQDFSTRVELPEPADVMVSDLRGVLPLFEKHIPSIADARRRLLKPGGRQIPTRDEIWAAVVEDAARYEEITSAWGEEVYGCDLRAGRRAAVNGWMKGPVKAEQLLTGPARWGSIDYTTVEDPNLRGELRWQVQRRGTGHGLTVWGDATLAGGVGFSNAPGAPEAIYGQAFFPWSEAVELEAGDVVEAALRADLVGDDYVWSWNTRVLRAGRQLAAFQQSTFYGEPQAPGQLKKRAASHAPERNEDAEIDRFILERMDGRRTLGEIAAQLQAAFPMRFATVREALTHAGELSVRYSK